MNIYFLWQGYTETLTILGYTERDMHTTWYEYFPHIIHPCYAYPAGAWKSEV